MLANAVYFQAPWQFKFRSRYTKRGAFTLLDGTRLPVDMMSQAMHFRYAETADCQLVEMPYDGEETAMLVLLPRPGRFPAIEREWTPSTMQPLLDRLEDREVRLKLPRFSCTSEFQLKEALSLMGMPSPFRPGADFTGIAGPGDYYLTDVLHKATVRVDEDGTVAAAGTYVGVAAAIPEPVDFTADRPFIFLIRDRRTGAILFLGRLLDPRG
jgi:serpin B